MASTAHHGSGHEAAPGVHGRQVASSANGAARERGRGTALRNRGAEILTFMWHYKRMDAKKCQGLCEELAQLPDEALLRCLPQLCQMLLQTAADADAQLRQPLEGCMRAACARSVLLSLQASWWFAANAGDSSFLPRCASLRALCAEACSSGCGAAANAHYKWKQSAQASLASVLTAAHSFAGACIGGDASTIRAAPGNHLSVSIDAAYALVTAWDSHGQGASGKIGRYSCGLRSVAAAAKQMLTCESVSPAYDIFLRAAADADEEFCEVADGPTEFQHGPAEDTLPTAAFRGQDCDGSDGDAGRGFFDRQLAFVSSLSKLSSSLRGVPAAERDSALKQSIAELNEELKGPAQALSKCLMHNSTTGLQASQLPVVFPLSKGGASPLQLHRVLCVVAQRSQVLKSRERTPLMLHMEVVAEGVGAGVSAPDDALVDARPALSNAEGSALPRGAARSDQSARISGGDDHQCFGVSFTPVGLSDTITMSSPAGILPSGGEPEPEPEPEPAGIVFETTSMIEQQLRASSVYARLPGWGVSTLIVKSGDDIRQEQLAMQLIAEFDQIFKEQKLALWLCPYTVMAVDPLGGIIEPVPSVLSIHALKER
jgi:hypothetical protein